MESSRNQPLKIKRKPQQTLHRNQPLKMKKKPQQPLPKR